MEIGRNGPFTVTQSESRNKKIGAVLNHHEVTGLVKALSLTSTDSKVGSVKVKTTVVMSSTQCENSVRANSITVIRTQANSLKAKEGIIVVNSTISEKVRGRFATVNQSSVGAVCVKNYARLENNSTARSVSAGSDVILDGSRVNGNVKAEENVLFLKSIVDGDVFFKGKAFAIEDFEVTGSLTCVSNHLTLKNCKIRKVHLQLPAGAFSVQSDRVSAKIGSSTVILEGGIVCKQTVVRRKYPKQKTEIQRSQVLEIDNCDIDEVIFEGGEGKVIYKGESNKVGSLEGGK